jgi:hypothetical protein
MMIKWISAGLTFAAVVFAAAGCSQNDNTASTQCYQCTPARPVVTGVGDNIGHVVYGHVTHELDQALLGPVPSNGTATANLDRD